MRKTEQTVVIEDLGREAEGEEEVCHIYSDARSQKLLIVVIYTYV